MAFIQQTAFSVSPKKLAGSAALISVVPVMVDIEFAGGRVGLVGSCDGGTIDKDIVVREIWAGELVVGAAGGAVVVKEVTGGRRFITKVLGWKLEGDTRR